MINLHNDSVSEVIESLYPFLFIYKDKEIGTFYSQKDKEEFEKNRKYIVVIAEEDYVEEDYRWADDVDIGNYPLRPDIDIVKETYKFTTKTEALRFIQKWWSKQVIK